MIFFSNQCYTSKHYLFYQHLIHIACIEHDEPCPLGWFVCDNKNCVSEPSLCNAINDCGDFSNQHNCQTRRRRGLLKLKTKNAFVKCLFRNF